MGINSKFFSKSNCLKLRVILFICLSMSRVVVASEVLTGQLNTRISYFNLSYLQTNFQKSINSDFVPYTGHGVQVGYGKETFGNTWILITTEINIASQLARSEQMYSMEVTNKIHPQYIQHFFSEVGLLSIKRTDAYLTGLTVGVGIVFNHNDIIEIPQLFNLFRTENFEKKISKQPYDFFIKANSLLYSSLKADPIMNSNFGIRIYF